MSITPIITFKAGICDFEQDATPPKVLPKPTQGYIYLYSEDDLVHFCWRTRAASLSNPTLDLIMFPGDGRFVPFEGKKTSNASSSSNPLTNGRIYVLKFSSSSQRHFFWLQSKSQHPQGNPSFFSPRDVKLGQLVDLLLQGQDVDVEREIANIPSGGGRPDDDDETMEDADEAREADHHRAPSGGAGAGATGGDFREEGEGPREGGADGGRAAAQPPTDAAAAVANFLQSLQGNQKLGASQANAQGKPFTTLPDLLPPATTLPMLESASPQTIDNLLSHVPPILLLLAQEIDDLSGVDPTSETAQAAIAALSAEQKKDILTRVLRSPQFNQSLGSLTVALRDGGLPAISEALGIRIEGGYMRRNGMMIGGGEAVEAFLKGVRDHVLAERKGEDEGMDLS